MILIALCVTNAHAYRANFTWSSNPEPLIGYILHFEEGPIAVPPFKCIGLNNNLPKIISKEEAEDTDYTRNIAPDKSSTYIDGLSPYKVYRFALTAYTGGTCDDDVSTPDIDERTLTFIKDGKTYCESDYTKAVYVGIQPYPSIKNIYLNL